MATCNKDAGDKKCKGVDHKTFTKACLSNKGQGLAVKILQKTLSIHLGGVSFGMMQPC